MASRLALGLVGLWVCSGNVSAADISTDGSLGAQVNLAGTEIELPQALGTRRGDNLFHSFERFSVAEGDLVQFTGSSAIEHVISRVTGGAASDISGTLRSDIGQAGFWLINPSGIAFGPNAVIDVPGGFHVSSGSEIRFADDSVFRAIDTNGSTLSVAEPQAFGFLGSRGAIALSGTKLDARGAVEFASAGDLTLDRDTQIRMRGENGDIALRAQGEIVLVDQASLLLNNESNSDARGLIALNAEKIRLEDRSRLLAETRNDGDAGDVILNAPEIELRDRALVSSTTFGNGMAGRITIAGQNLRMVGSGTPSNSTLIASGSQSTGMAGGVEIAMTGRLELREGARITSNAVATGDGGSIAIRAGSIVLRSDSRISSSGNRLDNQLGGAGGVITLEADDIEIRNARVRTQSEKRSGDITIALHDGQGRIEIAGSQGQITSSTFSSGGAAGRITITGADGQLSLVDRGRISVIARGSATGGNVEIDVGEISLADRAVITATTEGREDGGQVRINSDRLVLQGTGDPQRSSIISSSSSGRGNAGGVSIDVTQGVELRAGARITSNATDRGDGGEIRVAAAEISLTDDSRISSSGNELRNALGGAGGRITLQADRIVVANSRIRTESEKASGNISLSPRGDEATILLSGAGGQVSSATFRSGGSAGNVVVDAGQGRVALSDNASINAVNRGRGTGGRVEVRGDRLTLTGQSNISTTTEGVEDAGRVLVSVGELRIQGQDGNRPKSPIISSSSLNKGDAGLVDIEAQRRIIVNDGGRITSNSTNRGSSGNVVIRTSELVLTGNSAISSSGNPSRLGGSGDAGGIDIRTNNTVIHGSTVRTEAANAVGGELRISAEDTIQLNDATIVTDGLRSRDNSSLITLDAGNFLIINRSRVFSRVADGGEGLTPQATNSVGVANIIGGQITISSDSDLQATFAINVIGQENDVGSGLALPENVITDVSRLLNNRCQSNSTNATSSFRANTARQLSASPTDALNAAVPSTVLGAC